MTYRSFTLETADKVAHLRLNRPEKLNALDGVFWQELDAILAQLQRDAPARALVISSSGKHFSAGMDLAVFEQGEALPEGNPAARTALHEQILQLQHTFTRLEALRMPVIAAVQGACVGGALDMVTACDIRYAAQDAFFCVQEINIGLVADVGTLQRLPKLIPEAVAREYAYSGRRLPAARARELGLVNEVFSDQAAAVEAALVLAREIAAKSPTAMWASKQAVNYAREHTVADSLNQMAVLQMAVWQSRDVAEAVRANAEKRAARFDDLAPVPPFGAAT
ncbi:MAG TPA: crotonase/enoyl-CoA hydratase family protein [Burkholderiales bacterium]|nr:crotonase/enoyl-CoA hydratase family protein [Burkholderiales bacterium]